MKSSKFFVCVVIACMFSSCVSKTDRIEKAIEKNKFEKAEKKLKKIRKWKNKKHYGGLLIEAYLDNDNIDRAIYVFENITGHCSMYDMQWDHKWAAEYTNKYSRKIYKALLEDGRYDEAWNYHALRYESEDYPGNAENYFSYMTDVVLSMCSTGHSAAVPRFIKTKSLWFTKNIDNNKYGKEYPDYTHSNACNRLYQIYHDLNRIEELEKNFNAAQFAPGKAELTTKAMAVLNDLAKEMQKRPEISLRIVGHTSAEGEVSFNQKLSEARAQAAVDFLVSRGISADRLEAEGKGSSEPLDVNNPDVNRRTEFIVID